MQLCNLTAVASKRVGNYLGTHHVVYQTPIIMREQSRCLKPATETRGQTEQGCYVLFVHADYLYITPHEAHAPAAGVPFRAWEQSWKVLVLCVSGAVVVWWGGLPWGDAIHMGESVTTHMYPPLLENPLLHQYAGLCFLATSSPRLFIARCITPKSIGSGPINAICVPRDVYFLPPSFNY